MVIVIVMEMEMEMESVGDRPGLLYMYDTH